MRKKIVLVGAGSAVFTKGLMLDIMERQEESWSVSLVDANEEVLGIMEALCGKMIRLKNADIELEAHTNIKNALRGADFVVSTIGVGGRRAWEQDVFIPRKYGVFQPVGDTIGPGGISRAMRMVPQLIEIAKSVKEICPNVYFFTYSNPMTMNCMAIIKATGVPVIGLCHGVKNGIRRVAGFMNIPHDEISYTACGLNHMVFMYHMRRNGKDLFPEFINKLEDNKSTRIGPLTAGFVKKHNAYVVSDDRHFAEFVPESMTKNGYFGKTLGVDAFSFERTIGAGDSEFENYVSLAKSKDELPPDFFEREQGENEELLDIIDSLSHDKPRLYYANLPNNGAVQNLPHNTVIERPAFFDGSGIQPLQMTNFPLGLMPAMAKYSTVYDIAVEAALTGNTRLVRLAIEECSPVLEKGQVDKMTDELLFANNDFLQGVGI